MRFFVKAVRAFPLQNIEWERYDISPESFYGKVSEEKQRHTHPLGAQHARVTGRRREYPEVVPPPRLVLSQFHEVVDVGLGQTPVPGKELDPVLLLREVGRRDCPKTEEGGDERKRSE